MVSNTHRQSRKAALRGLTWPACILGIFCFVSSPSRAQFNIQHDGQWAGQFICDRFARNVRANIVRGEFVMLRFLEGGLENLRGQVTADDLIELTGRPDDSHAGEWTAKFKGKFQGDFFTAVGRLKGPKGNRECTIVLQWASSL